jgi:hypothetical protein
LVSKLAWPDFVRPLLTGGRCSEVAVNTGLTVLCFLGAYNQSQIPSTQTQSLQKLSILELTDRNLAWQHLLRTEEMASEENTGSMLNVYNIGWAKAKQIQTGLTFKMPILVGAIKSIDLTIGLDPK